MPDKNQPTSFRFPFDLEGVEPKIKASIRYAFTGLKDLNDAIRALTPKVGANSTKIETLTTNVTAAAAPAPTPTLNFGTVNLQPNLTPGAYTTVQADFGGLILVQSAIPFAYTLDSGLVTPFFTTVFNLGSANVTATPTLGSVNNGASVTVVPNQLAIFFFDSSGNWWAVFPLLAQTIAAVAKNWLRSYDAATGLFTASQPTAADLSNGTTGTGAVVLATGPTLASTVSITGLQAFANNAAAITGGLVAGNLYRTGGDPDLVAVVH